MEFFRRTNRAVAFVSSTAGLCRHLTACFHTGSIARTTAREYKNDYPCIQWIGIPSCRNAEMAPEELCVGGLKLLFAPLSVAELIRLLPQQLPLCPAPRIHFCANSMQLIKTVAIALEWEWLSQKIHSPPNYKGNFMSWKTESNYFNKHKAFSIEQQSWLI